MNQVLFMNHDGAWNSLAKNLEMGQLLSLPGTCFYKLNHMKYKFFFIHLCVQEDDFADWIKWPNADYVKNFKKKKREFGDYPSPDDCILEMVNYQLKVCTMFQINVVFLRSSIEK